MSGYYVVYVEIEKRCANGGFSDMKLPAFGKTCEDAQRKARAILREEQDIFDSLPDSYRNSCSFNTSMSACESVNWQVGPFFFDNQSVMEEIGEETRKFLAAGKR